MRRRAFLLGLTACASRAVWPDDHWDRLIAYNRAQGGVSLLVMQNGKTLCEDYSAGEDQAYELASGTKSFWGTLAVVLNLDLDEPMGVVLQEWASDTRNQITLRQLLTLTSGIPGGTVGQPPTFAQALEAAQRFPAGTRFQYGPAPYQAFGAYLRRKYRMDPLDLLQRHILGPSQVRYQDWKRGSDGQIHLPSGARLNARNWARFGAWVLKNQKALARCFQGSGANLAYGLTWWLKKPVEERVRSNVGAAMRNILELGGERSLPEDIWIAAGAGNQRLYIVPSQSMVIVRQDDRLISTDARYSDRDFMVTALS